MWQHQKKIICIAKIEWLVWLANLRFTICRERQVIGYQTKKKKKKELKKPFLDFLQSFKNIS